MTERDVAAAIGRLQSLRRWPWMRALEAGDAAAVDTVCDVLEEATKWKEAVIDAAVVDWTLTAENVNNPRKCVEDVLAWQSKLALDPAVSKEAHDLHDALEQAQRSLAECYRLSGADPDGNEDWRLARDAVVEVQRLRREYDEAQVMAGREWFRAENADAKGILCEEAQLAAEAKLAKAQQRIARLQDDLMVARTICEANSIDARVEEAESLATELVRALEYFSFNERQNLCEVCHLDKIEGHADDCWLGSLLADSRIQALSKADT